MVFFTSNGAVDIFSHLNFIIIVIIINDLTTVYSMQYAMPSFVVYCPLHAPGCHKYIINVFYSINVHVFCKYEINLNVFLYVFCCVCVIVLYLNSKLNKCSNKQT